MTLGLNPDELALQARAREFSQSLVRPRAAAIDRDEQYPWDIVRALAEQKFLGMTIPVETNMGAISTVMAYGSEAQKRRAAELVLAGDKPAICITEPEAGSDANA